MTTAVRRRARPRRGGRRVLVLLLLATVAVLGCAGWLVVRGALAARHLQAARSSLLAARSALTDTRFADAKLYVDSAGLDTAAARRLTGDPVWAAAARLPVVGNTLTVSRGLARAADDTSRTLLPGVLDAVAGLDPAALRHGNRRADVALLLRLQPVLRTATEQGQAISAEVSALPTGQVAGPVQSAREAFVLQLRQLMAALTSVLRT